jgi:transporter family-2 protein
VSTGSFAVALATLAGVAGAAQVAVMGRFGEGAGVFAALAFSTLATALLALVALAVATRGLGGYADAAREPVWLWIGGALGLFVVLSITVAGPRIGTTATVALLIAGQLAAAVAIDRFGLFGAEEIGVGWQRVTGVALLALGAALTVRY